MKVGFFGGTFDPIHIGHLIVAEAIRDDYPLDKIVFLPADIPPHKEAQDVSPTDVRLMMCRAAVDGLAGFDVSDAEIQAGGVSYTIDTVERLLASEAWRGDDLHLILGMDSLADLDTWKTPEKLLRRIDVLVTGRPGFGGADIDPRFEEHVTFVEAPMIAVSSTGIRERVRSGRSIRFLVPEAVETIIHDQRLYG